MNNSSIVEDDSGSVELDNLYPALIQCFAIILCGYIAARFNLVSQQESKGLNMFVSTFSLPSLIFLSLAQLDLTSVNWKFLCSILVAKSLVFFAVVLVTFCVSRPFNCGIPGIYAIFCTQSNDFAIGYPILLALYNKSHSDYPSYLYLMAPISLAILNPLAYILLEFGKRQSSSPEVQSDNSKVVPNQGRDKTVGDDNTETNIDEGGSEILREDVDTDQHSQSNNKTGFLPTTVKNHIKFCMIVVRNIFSNPVVFMTVLGLFGNMVYKYIGFLTGILQAFGSAFSATALFVLGIRMVGSVHKLKGSDLVVPGVLIGVKLLVLPLVIREVVSVFQPGSNSSETLDLSTFGFLYGTFPTAPAVFVFSLQYNIEVDLISSAMVACTFISAPLMFISAKMTSLDRSSPDSYFKDINSFGFDISIAGIFLGIWILFLFVIGKKLQRLPHKITGFLIASQMTINCGMILWSLLDRSSSWSRYFQFSIFAFGVYSSRIWTAFLAVTLLLLQTKSLCFALKLTPFFVIGGWGIPIILVTALCLSATSEGEDNLTPNFEYGSVEAIISLIVLIICFSVSSCCLILQQRYHRRYARYLLLVQEVNSKDLKEVHGSINADIAADSEGLGDTIATPDTGDSTTSLKEVVDIEDIVSGGSKQCEGVSTSSHQPGDLCPSRFQCSEFKRGNCGSKVEEYNNRILSEDSVDPDLDTESQLNGDQEVLPHVVLLLCLISSMFVGIMLSIWTLVVEDPFSGIYVEASFLDVTLNIGQIFLTFAAFGLDVQPVFNVVADWWRKIYYGADTIVLTEVEQLSFETVHICNQFISYHLSKCKEDIARDRRWRLQNYRLSFKGCEMVAWLQQIGLAKDVTEAVQYASHLLEGRVIRHVENRHHFVNSSLLYTFETP